MRARGFLEFVGLGLGAAGYGGVETGFREGTASLGAPSFGTGIIIRGNWGERRGLNPRPSVPQTDALPAELRSPHGKTSMFMLVIEVFASSNE